MVMGMLSLQIFCGLLLCVFAPVILQKADKVSGLSPSAVSWQMWQAVSVHSWE